jgi:hypothetical protein
MTSRGTIATCIYYRYGNAREGIRRSYVGLNVAISLLAADAHKHKSQHELHL